MIIDEVIITIEAGDGGKGSVSFKRNAQTPKGGPDGGNGGNGGSIYFQGINDINALRIFRYKKVIKAENGIAGGRQNLYGRNGKDTIVFIPLGTQVTDIETQNSIEILDTTTKVLLAKGGQGGKGNNEFKSATNQTPRYAEPGEKGEVKKLHLTLRIIADIGLIGLPNAGKSSLLSVLTNAEPKIGNYPFTTLEPNLGVMDKMVLADIPGLIEGASQGKGLGIKFLKHIEKTKFLLHCIDATEKDVFATYTTVINELQAFSPLLTQKKQLILLTKTDLLPDKEVQQKLKLLKKTKQTILTISIYQEESLNTLRKSIKEFFGKK